MIPKYRKHSFLLKYLSLFQNKGFLLSATIRRFQHALAETNGSCEYPPILDTSREAKLAYNRQSWYDSIKALPTVEQKLFELSYQQRLNLKKYLLSAVPSTYSGVDFHRFITRTHLVKDLPEKLRNINVDKELSEIKDSLNSNLQNVFCNNWQADHKNLADILNEKYTGSRLVNQLLSNCYKKLSQRNEYIWDSTIQQRPRINSFFWHQGFESKKKKIYEENLCFYFADHPALIVRTKMPLDPVLDFNDPICKTADVPNFHYHPSTFGVPFHKKGLRNVPGFWPGDPHEFPFLVVKTTHQMKSLLNNISYYDLEKIEDSIGIMASFGLLNSFATNLGFTPFHDLTYPLVSQLILTNGQDFTFFVYQLNTVAFHADVDRRDRGNVCWSSGKMRLFDTIEDGAVRGVNEEVYKVLLQFLLNAPTPNEALVLKPYLGEDTRTQEEITRTRFLLRRLFSHIPWDDAHKEEVPHWVRIYKMHKDAPPAPYLRLY